MAITGPIIPAKSQVSGAVPSASTTITNTLVNPSTSTETTDRAIQVGEIISNVVDGKLWIKKIDETFSPIARSKTLGTWCGWASGASGLVQSSGPGSGSTVAAVANTTGTGIVSVLNFLDAGSTAHFYGIIPEGSSWNSLNLIIKFATLSGTGSVQFGVSMQKTSTTTDVTFTTESLVSTNNVSQTWVTATLPINIPTGLTSGDFYRIRLRRTPGTTNDTSSQTVHLLSAELRAV